MPTASATTTAAATHERRSARGSARSAPVVHRRPRRRSLRVEPGDQRQPADGERGGDREHQDLHAVLVAVAVLRHQRPRPAGAGRVHVVVVEHPQRGAAGTPPGRARTGTSAARATSASATAAPRVGARSKSSRNRPARIGERGQRRQDVVVELGVDQRHRRELDEEPDQREADELRRAATCRAACVNAERGQPTVAMPDHGNMP